MLNAKKDEKYVQNYHNYVKTHMLNEKWKLFLLPVLWKHFKAQSFGSNGQENKKSGYARDGTSTSYP